MPDRLRGMLHCGFHFLSDPRDARREAGRHSLRPAFERLQVRLVRQAGAAGRLRELAAFARDVRPFQRGSFCDFACPRASDETFRLRLNAEGHAQAEDNIPWASKRVPVRSGGSHRHSFWAGLQNPGQLLAALRIEFVRVENFAAVAVHVGQQQPFVADHLNMLVKVAH